jgi:hypothetical protein
MATQTKGDESREAFNNFFEAVNLEDKKEALHIWYNLSWEESQELSEGCNSLEDTLRALESFIMSQKMRMEYIIHQTSKEILDLIDFTEIIKNLNLTFGPLEVRMDYFNKERRRST